MELEAPSHSRCAVTGWAEAWGGEKCGGRKGLRAQRPCDLTCGLLNPRLPFLSP